MYTTQYNCYGLGLRYSKQLAVLTGFSIVAFVFYGVNLYLGKQLPKTLKGSDPYFLIAGFLFAIWCVVLYYVRRFKIIVSGDDKGLQVEIDDPELYEPILLSYPFQVCKQWIRRRNGQTYIKELYLSFLDQNDAPIVTLKGSLGDLRDVPEHFIYIDHNTEDRRLLKISERIYTTKVTDLEDVLYIHLNYLRTRIN